MEPRMEKSISLSTRSIQAGMDADSETKAAKRALVVSINYAIPPIEGYAAVPHAYDRD